MVKFTIAGTQYSYEHATDTVRWDTVTCCLADAPVDVRRAARRAWLYRTK